MVYCTKSTKFFKSLIKKKRKTTKKSQREEGSSDTVPQNIRERMKNIFNEIYSHVESLTDENEG